MVDIAFIMNAQNSYLSPTGSVYLGERAEVLKVRLADWLSDCGMKRVFFREKRSIQDSFYRSDVTHSIATTEDFFIAPELLKFADVVYDKTRYSAFHKTGLETYAKQEGLRTAVVLGLETHTSVLFSVEEFRNLGYEVRVVEPCTLSRDDFLHGWAVSLMRNCLGVEVGS